MKMPRRRYRVSLVGYDDPIQPARSRPLARVAARAGRALLGWTWQRHAALACLILALVVLILRFV